MYSTIKEIAEALWVPLCLSMMGFIVRIVRSGVASWQTFISSLFCSAFAGILAHWFLAGSGIDTQIASAVIAMSGYCGGALIDAITGVILRRVEGVSHIYPPLEFPPINEILQPHNELDPTDKEQRSSYKDLDPTSEEQSVTPRNTLDSVDEEQHTSGRKTSQ